MAVIDSNTFFGFSPGEEADYSLHAPEAELPEQQAEKVFRSNAVKLFHIKE